MATEVGMMPGTVILEDLQGASPRLVLQPTPTADPNDPLNWSSVRKTVNFTLACFYALMTFVLLDIGSVVWVNVNEELGISYKDLNYSWAIDCAGLALGCIFLYPLAVKFGRRPVYILSLIVQLAGAIWFAHMQSNWENMVINFIIGLAGAISETIVQMTIADLFFTHQRASANAMYFFVVTIGTFLAPVAAGYCAASQGWRWIWWWCVILLAVNLIAVLVFFEETKYIPVLPGSPVSSPSSDVGVFAAEEGKKVLASDECTIDLHRHNSIVADITKKSDVQRLALITKSNGPLFRYSYQPVIVLTKFPAAAFTALIYGANLAWYSVCGTTAATYLVYDPYDFGSIGVGLFSLAPFLGSLLAALYSGPLADFYIVWASKRNGGVFEPEMRLHLALLAVLLTPLGLLLYGLPLANVFRRLISPFVYAFKPTLNNADQCSLARAYRGLFLLSAVYGFAFSMIADLSLTYLLDCYQDVVGDALVGVAFVRNATATVVVFAQTPWIAAQGLYNFFVTMTCLAVALILPIIPMIWFGKAARRATAGRYKKFAMLQPNSRTFQ